MKVILSGSTGFIGGGVLKRLLELPDITSIVALSRRELAVQDAKLETIILKDFTSYPESVTSKFVGADAAIWCLGSPTSGIAVHDGFTMAAVQALVGMKGQLASKFRFVLVSGDLIQRDQTKMGLPFLGGLLKARGRVESKVLDVQAQHPDVWESYVVRPSMVTKGESLIRFVAPSLYIPVSVLAAAMVDLATNGAKQDTWDNSELKNQGKSVLAVNGKT